MVEIGFYLVTESIARRAGVIDARYRTQDGRYVLDDKDLSYIRLTPEEYLTGLQGIERVTRHEAMEEIQKENYQIGEPALKEEQASEVETPTEDTQEPQEEALEEEATENNGGSSSDEVAEESEEKEKNNENDKEE